MCSLTILSPVFNSSFLCLSLICPLLFCSDGNLVLGIIVAIFGVISVLYVVNKVVKLVQENGIASSFYSCGEYSSICRDIHCGGHHSAGWMDVCTRVWGKQWDPITLPCCKARGMWQLNRQACWCSSCSSAAVLWLEVHVSSLLGDGHFATKPFEVRIVSCFPVFSGKRGSENNFCFLSFFLSSFFTANEQGASIWGEQDDVYKSFPSFFNRVNLGSGVMLLFSGLVFLNKLSNRVV